MAFSCEAEQPGSARAGLVCHDVPLGDGRKTKTTGKAKAVLEPAASQNAWVEVDMDY